MTRTFRPAFTLASLNQEMLGEQMAGHLGIRFTELADQSLSAEVKIGIMHARPGGIMNGGMSLTLMETVASAAAMGTIEPSTHDVLGLQVTASHVHKVQMGETLRATATAEHLGRSTQIWNLRLTSADHLVALGRVTLMVVPRAT